MRSPSTMPRRYVDIDIIIHYHHHHSLSSLLMLVNALYTWNACIYHKSLIVLMHITLLYQIPSISLTIYLSVYQSTYLYLSHLSLFMYLSIYPSISICISTYLSLSVSLSVSLFVSRRSRMYSHRVDCDLSVVWCRWTLHYVYWTCHYTRRTKRCRPAVAWLFPT